MMISVNVIANMCVSEPDLAVTILNLPTEKSNTTISINHSG